MNQSNQFLPSINIPPHHQHAPIGQPSYSPKPPQETEKSTLKIEESKDDRIFENDELTEEEKVKEMLREAKKFQNYFGLLVKLH